MSRTYLIAGNWKMNKTPREAAALAEAVKGMKKALHDRGHARLLHLLPTQRHARRRMEKNYAT